MNISLSIESSSFSNFSEVNRCSQTNKYHKLYWIADIITLYLLPDLKAWPLSTKKKRIDQEAALRKHNEVEVLFGEYMNHLASRNLIDRGFSLSMHNAKFRRIQLFSALNQKPLISDVEHKKIENRVWKFFLGEFFFTEGIELISYKKISKEKTVRNYIKASDCAYFAFHKMKNHFLETIFCKLSSEELKEKAITKKIKVNKKIDPEKWSKEYDNWWKLLKDKQLFVSLLINHLKYHMVLNQTKDDLIIYLNNEGGWEHFGVCYDSKLVESKWGKLPVFRHLTKDSPYGSSYILLRPNFKD